MFSTHSTILPQVRDTDSYHGRADAFEATFERSYLAFQLHCRGVQALRQSLREKGSVSVDGDACPNPGADASEPAASPKTGGGLQAVSETRSSGERAETHLLRTLGAQLAELITARECEKLVRTPFDPSRVRTHICGQTTVEICAESTVKGHHTRTSVGICANK